MSEPQFSLPPPPEPKKPESPDEVVATLRERLRDQVEQIPQLPTLLAIVADACVPDRTWKATGQCTVCGCKHAREFTSPRHEKALKAVEFLLTHLEGRPGVANTEDAGVVVKRIVVKSSDTQ